MNSTHIRTHFPMKRLNMVGLSRYKKFHLHLWSNVPNLSSMMVAYYHGDNLIHFHLTHREGLGQLNCNNYFTVQVHYLVTMMHEHASMLTGLPGYSCTLDAFANLLLINNNYVTDACYHDYMFICFTLFIHSFSYDTFKNVFTCSVKKYSIWCVFIRTIHQHLYMSSSL